MLITLKGRLWTQDLASAWLQRAFALGKRTEVNNVQPVRELRSLHGVAISVLMGNERSYKSKPVKKKPALFCVIMQLVTP